VAGEELTSMDNEMSDVCEMTLMFTMRMTRGLYVIVDTAVLGSHVFALGFTDESG
jgi:hypothetical protein